MKKSSILVLLFFLTLFACRKDVVEELTSTTDTPNPDIILIGYEPEVLNITATLFGEVINESGAPVSNATVTLDNNTTSTDDKGRFVFKDITMNQLGTFVAIKKNGYFPGSHRFFPEEGSVNYSKTTLLEQSNIGNFPSNAGALISSSEGISIDFPSNSVVDEDGELYQGTVEVAARWIDPTANNLNQIMPGGLQGLMPGGTQGTGDALEEVALASFGMMAVELTGSSGEALNLGNEKLATLSFPVPAELLSNAPASIPLWYFHESVGLWVIEGSAALEGDKYVGDVSHFSFWNCDAPFDLAKVCGTILSSSGTPLVNTLVEIKITSDLFGGFGWTNSEGEFSGKVPANELLEIKVYENWSCTEIYTENIGSLPPDTTTCQDLGIINLPNTTEVIDITATVLDCAGSALTNGWIEINLNGNDYAFYIEDGNDVSMSLFNCNNQTELTVLAGNIDDLELSDEMTYNITYPLNLGTISACGNASTENLTIIVDGITTVFPVTSFFYYGFPNQDTVGINASIPGTNKSVSIATYNITATGNYDESIINYINMTLESSTGGDLSLFCGVFWGPCGLDQFNITSFGAIGEFIVGDFQGTADFSDGTGTVNLPYSATFSIIRDN